MFVFVFTGVLSQFKCVSRRFVVVISFAAVVGFFGGLSSVILVVVGARECASVMALDNAVGL